MNFQGWEWIIILAALLLLFGARKLPELARSIGASSREFRKGLEEGSKEVDEVDVVVDQASESDD